MFCCTLLYVHSSIAIILMGKRELMALLNLSSWCLVMVERLFLAVPRGCLQFVIVVFPDHTHLLFLNLSITNDIVSSKIYDKRDDFNFEIGNFPFLDGDVLRSPSYGVYISQLIGFARVCSNTEDYNNRNLLLTAKLLKQGYRYHKIRKAFSKFYHRHSELIVKYNIGLKTLLQQGISEPIFYGDLYYKFKRIVGKPNFSDQFKKIIKRYIRLGYNLDIMRQSACLVLNPITVYSYGFLFNCTTVGQASDSMTALT